MLRNIFTEDFTFVSCKKNQKWKRSDFIKMGMSELKVLKSFNEKFKNSENKKRKIIATKKYKMFYVIKGEGVCVSICVFVYIPCPMHAFKAEE